MKNARFISLVCMLLLALCSPAWAKDKIKGKGVAGTDRGEKTPAKPAAPPAPAAGKEPWIQAKVVISSNEREVIRSYAKSCTVAERPGKKPKGLPPGLAKKVARGGELPPGWQKKCVRGEIMPTEVYKVCHPLPQEVVVKLPPPPPGTILVTIDGRVVRLAKATLEILDVFEVL